jgi:HMG (high mobility group) box
MVEHFLGPDDLPAARKLHSLSKAPDPLMVEHFFGSDDVPAATKSTRPSKVVTGGTMGEGKGKAKGMRRVKAPGAPKRFRSSYICFFTANQSSIKKELGEDASVSNISKRSAELWKALSAEERAVWDEIAFKDKKRYMTEKSQYTGPWQVPFKRHRKDPAAPKKACSSFLYFSQEKRTEIKTERPKLKNTDVSRLLGEMWRNLSDEERAPYVERERCERERYKVAMATWREDQEAIKQLDDGQEVVDHHDLGDAYHNNIHMHPMGNQYGLQGQQNSKCLHHLLLASNVHHVCSKLFFVLSTILVDAPSL